MSIVWLFLAWHLGDSELRDLEDEIVQSIEEGDPRLFVDDPG